METTLYCKKCDKQDLELDYDVLVKNDKMRCFKCGCVVREVCSYCLGTQLLVEDGFDENGNIERGVNCRKCPFCDKEAEE